MSYFPVYAQQAAFLDATEPIRGFVGGQGAGKSKIGALDLLERALPGRLYMVVAPTYPMLRDSTFRTFREVAEQGGRWIPSRFTKTEFTAVVHCRPGLGGMAEVLFRSGEQADRLRGPNVSGLWMDEASLLQHEAFQIAVARLREAGEAGWLSATFTPKGLGHWTYEVFGQQKPGVFLIHARTRDNPFVSEQFIDTVSHQYVGTRAAQELDGRFVSVEGAEWPPEYFDYPGFWFDQWPAQLDIKTMACDPSLGTDAKGTDYQAHVWTGRAPDGYLYVEADLRRCTVTEMVQTGLETCKAFRPDGFAIEMNNFQQLLRPEYERIGRAMGLMHIPIYPVDNYVKKAVRIRRLTPYLSRQKLRFKAQSKGTALLVQQMRDFTGDTKDVDDGPDALEVSVRLMAQLWQGKAGKR